LVGFICPFVPSLHILFSSSSFDFFGNTKEPGLISAIDYAAPEVLAGHPYAGPAQDVWALGILLYTILYKENPFYSIDEIMDHDLRVPYVVSEESIALVKMILERDVEKRWGIEEVLGCGWLRDEG